MYKIIYILIFFMSFSLFSFTGEVHLHLKNFRKSYKASLENPLVKDFLNSNGFKIFKESKLYMRLEAEFGVINNKNNIFTKKTLKKLDAKSFDLYLMNTEDLDFLIVTELSIQQLTLLIDFDINAPTTTLKGEKLYILGPLFLMVKDKNILITNNKANIIKYIENESDFKTMNFNSKLYNNFLFLNMKKIIPLPYLRNYWFTKSELDNISDKVEILFNLTKNKFEESSNIHLKSEIENNKMFFSKTYPITIKSNKEIYFSLFKNIKEIKTYGVILNDKNKIYIADILIKKDTLKNRLKKEWPNSIWSEKDSKIKFKYGIMNRKSLLITINGNKMIFSTKSLSYKLVENKNIDILVLDKKGISLLKKELTLLKKFSENNYSYSQFYKNFLTLYLKHIITFTHKTSSKDKVLTSYTKIDIK